MSSLAWVNCGLWLGSAVSGYLGKDGLSSELEDVLAVVFVGPPTDAVYVFCGEKLWPAEHRCAREDDGGLFGHEHCRFHSIRRTTQSDYSMILEKDYTRVDIKFVNKPYSF